MVALLFINVRLGLTLFAIIPVLLAVTVLFRLKSSRAYGEARERVSIVNAELPGERGRTAGRAGLPPRGAQLPSVSQV